MTIAVLALGVLVPGLAAAAGGHWKGSAYMPITESRSVEWGGKLKVTDSEYVFSGKTYKLTVECSDTVKGSVNTDGSGEVTSVTVSGCAGSENCQATGAKLTIAAVNLPWHTELAEEGTFLNRMVNGGKGTPGLYLECKFFGVAIGDTCTGNLNLDITKLESVTGAFDKSKALTCTLSGKATGFVEGSQSVSGVQGVEEETPIWLTGGGSPVNTKEAVTWTKGSLTLIDTTTGFYGAAWSVKCEEGGEGTVDTGGAGSITKVTFSKCEQGPESECNGTDALEALHLPWKTQLFMGGEEAISNLLMNDGSGVPAFKIKCEIHGLKEEENCEAGSLSGGRLATFLTNEIGPSVRASYYPNSLVGLHCERGGAGEAGELREGNYTIARGVQLQ